MPQFLPVLPHEESMVDVSSSLPLGEAKHIMLQSSISAADILQPDLADLKQTWVLPLYGAL